eukprot:c13893_g1_i3 orf=1162-1719(+)
MWKRNLPLSSLNHISLLCSSVETSVEFYENVLGFYPIKRPGSFNFDGAWLFNYGMGIHLIEGRNPNDIPKKVEIDPIDNHISFQCDDLKLTESILQEHGIKYIKRLVEEGGVMVDQLFFHDPDGFMIEVCNCDNIPVIPLGSEPACMLPASACMKRVASNLAMQLSESMPEKLQRGIEEYPTACV